MGVQYGDAAAAPTSNESTVDYEEGNASWDIIGGDGDASLQVGRLVIPFIYNYIKRFILLQPTINVVALIISAIALGKCHYGYLPSSGSTGLQGRLQVSSDVQCEGQKCLYTGCISDSNAPNGFLQGRAAFESSGTAPSSRR
ncbi:hypothetical protein L7F22_051098 [Adiantum nelumboides]|nr:hypothetical protein [Adiantum nelumboides]